MCDLRLRQTLLAAFDVLDYAVESFYYERGRDFYEDGQNYALVSPLYTAGPTFIGRTPFAGLQAAELIDYFATQFHIG
jgi:hypothetical protein